MQKTVSRQVVNFGVYYAKVSVYSNGFVHTANMHVVAREMQLCKTETTGVEDEHLHVCMRACESLVQVVRVLKRVRSRFIARKDAQCALNVHTVRRRLQRMHYKLPWCAAAELVYDNTEAARDRRAVLFAKQMLHVQAV